MDKQHTFHRGDLVRIAIDAMKERGLEPEFPPRALQQLQTIDAAGQDDDPRIRDLTALPWCSIDNDDSLDLDQLTACGAMGNGGQPAGIAECRGLYFLSCRSGAYF